MKLRTYALAGLFASVLMMGCGNRAGIQKVSTDQTLGQTSGSDDANSLQDPAVDSTLDISQATSGALMDAGYTLSVKSLLGIKVCDGEVNIKFNPMFSQDGKMFELPSSPVSCLFGLKKFDLGEMMGAMAGPPPADDGTDPLDVADNVIGLNKLGFAKFSPARPMFPSFLATELDDLKRLHVVRQIAVQDTKTGDTGSGVASVKVVGFEKSYRPPGMSFEFRNVITFQVIHTGFDGIDKLSNFIFEKMEMKVSLDPVAVPKIYMQGRVNDFTGAIGAGGAGGGGILESLTGAGGTGATGGLGGIVGSIAKVAKVEMELVMNRLEGIEDMRPDDDEDDDENKDEDEDEDEEE